MADISILRKFFIHVIHDLVATAKTVAMWSLGLLHLICLFNFPARTIHTNLWLRRLRSLGVNPFSYTFDFFETATVVYLKMPFHELTCCQPWVYRQHGRFYIGSTSIGVTKRDFNRMAKLRQVKLDKAVHAELAIKYWARRSDFRFFTILVLKTFEHYSDAWTFEHALLSKWQAPLNYPFIQRFLSLKASGWTVQFQKHRQRFSAMPLGDRLFQRVRRRLYSLGSVPSMHSFQTQAWRTLFCLTAPGRLSFDTSRSLRSGTFHDWEIYALFRLAGHLEQPTRGQARKLISKAMIFRNLTVPRQNRPLSVTFLSHASFSSDVQRFLRAHVLRHKHLAVPLHLPTTRLREAASPSLARSLFNYTNRPDLLCVDLPGSAVCSCFQIWRRLRYEFRGPCPPDGQRVSISAALTDLALPSNLSIFQNANMQSTYFKPRDAFFREFQSELNSWSRYHGLPPVEPVAAHQFLLSQWSLHVQELHHVPRFTEADLRRLKNWLPSDVILHHADHETYRLTIFCPRLYSTGAANTWKDDQLFARFPGTLEEAQTEVAMALPTRLQTRYSWGITRQPRLPNGFVFLKRKQFLKGRTLISYFRAKFAVLMQTAARTIDSMCVQLWPQFFGQLSVPNIWKRIHDHFQNVDVSISFGMINDDLVGFFNSIPQERLLDAVHSLVLAWKEAHGDIQLSVDMSRPGPIQHTTFVGQFRKRGCFRTIVPDDLIHIVAASLRSHIFTVGNLIFKQFRGAGIGAHISPSLSNLAVTMVEKTWAMSFRNALDDPQLSFLGIRYVDNRLILFNSFHSSSPCISLLAWRTHFFMLLLWSLSQLRVENFLALSLTTLIAPFLTN